LENPARHPKPILEDPSPLALAEAAEANLIALYVDLARSPQVTLHEEPGLVWFVTGVPSPSFNRILRAQFESEGIDAQIEAALAPFRARNLPLVWHTGPATRPADLGERLVAHGLQFADDEPGMAAALHHLDDEADLPSGLTTKLVDDLDGLRQWCEVFATAFGQAEGAVEATFSIEADLGVGEHPHRRLYLGSRRGEPVATAMLYLGAGVAGLHAVGTLPKARGQGIGRAMTVMALLEARAMDYRFGVLHASPLGLPIYRRLGFREHCRLCRYVWTGEAGLA
jgi:ribosomal protein S18 acetylase RimI-like enzyme